MSKNSTISLRSQWLGSRLKAARATAGLTLQDIADQMQVADTTLSRFEKGTVRIRRPYVKEMIDVYGISDPQERQALLQLNEDAWRKDWWDGDTNDLEVSFLDYTWLEARTSRIRQFETSLVPGLLQTPDYAMAIVRHSPGNATTAQIRRMVNLRIARQKILDGSSPVELSVVLEESAVHRPIGDAATHRQQLSHLLNMLDRGNVNMRILPADTGWHAGIDGSFTIFDMPDPYPGVVYIDSLATRSFLEDKTKVDQFENAYTQLMNTALTSQASAKRIKEAARDS